jgi:predicted extracellular nuclease
MTKKLIILVIFSAFILNLFSQNEFKIMTYNVENLFDTKDDTLYNDSEYLAGGLRGWTYARYREKLSNIAKVIVAVGEWEPPVLIGLCEIENQNTLYDLTQYTGLQALNYKFIHYESSDARGVDVALLYLPNFFVPLNSRAVNVKFPNSASTTRDILYVCGKIPNGDTLHIFVNHFSSRLGGELESEDKRLVAANFLRSAVDSVFEKSPKAAIIILGDFNDYPDNTSITKTLKANYLPQNFTEIEPQKLYNLVYKIHKESKIGSYLHNGEWGMLDQIIVSGTLLDNSLKIKALHNTIKVFDAVWLLQEDKILGLRPFRTYVGMRYNGGFSDHLPVFVKIRY